MNKANMIENIVLIAVMFVGLGFYTSLVLKPIVVEAIRTENSKIENNISTKIDNKFKRIEELNSNIPTSIEPTSNIEEVKKPKEKIGETEKPKKKLEKSS